MMNADRFAADVKHNIDSNGVLGSLKCKPLTDYEYDPATGETSSDGPIIDVMFVFVKLTTQQDQDVHRRALQRDTGLDRFVQGRILFYVVEEEEPTETGSLSYNNKTYAFTDLRPYMVNGKPIAYEALYTGAD